MFPWSIIGTALKTGAEIYKNKKKSEIIMSEAQIVHAEKMKRGEIEYSGQIAKNQKNDWKDEFVLLVLTSPLAILFYSVFAEDEEIQAKLDLYFKNVTYSPIITSQTSSRNLVSIDLNEAPRHILNFQEKRENKEIINKKERRHFPVPYDDNISH